MTNAIPAAIRELPLFLTVRGLRVPAALTLPMTGDPESAILLIPGSLNVNVDGDFPAWNMFPSVYAHLARQLATLGHSVYRFSKSGPGTGSEDVDAAAAATIKNWAGRMVIAEGALQEMRRVLGEMGMHPRRTVLAGHSEGAVVASLLAPNADAIDGVVLLSGPSVGLMSIMREQREAMEAANAPEARLTALAEFDAIVGCIRRREVIPADVRSKPGAGMLAQMNEAGQAYMHDVDAADPSAAVAGLPHPVLIAQGGRDESVRPHHADRLKAARGTRPTEMRFYPELQHFYKRVPEGVSGMAAFGLQGETDPRVTADIDRWVRGLSKT